MALKGNQARNSNNNGKDFEKAKAFINIALPTRDGKQLRLQSIPLVESNDTHAQLIKYVTGGDLPKGQVLTEEQLEERVAQLKERLIIGIGFPRTAEESALDL